jgi:hypothetical protein
MPASLNFASVDQRPSAPDGDIPVHSNPYCSLFCSKDTFRGIRCEMQRRSIQLTEESALLDHALDRPFPNT